MWSNPRRLPTQKKQVQSMQKNVTRKKTQPHKLPLTALQMFRDANVVPLVDQAAPLSLRYCCGFSEAEVVEVLIPRLLQSLLMFFSIPRFKMYRNGSSFMFYLSCSTCCPTASDVASQDLLFFFSLSCPTCCPKAVSL